LAWNVPILILKYPKLCYSNSINIPELSAILYQLMIRSPLQPLLDFEYYIQ